MAVFTGRGIDGFIATSNHVTHNVPATPFLWIVPLGLYLITFIISFDHERWYIRGLFATLCVLSIVLLVSYDSIESWAWKTYKLDLELNYMQNLVLYFTTMFLMCMVCHGEFVKLRPKNHQYLTEYYLFLSAGGALGGLFISFIATNFFNDYHEWPLGLLLCFAISGVVLYQVLKTRTQGFVVPGIAVVMLFGVIGYLGYQLNPFSGDRSQILFKARNFYGTVTVSENIFKEDLPAEENGGVARGPLDNTRTFRSGTILHGQQFIDPQRRLQPIAYYHPDSAAGQTMRYVIEQNPEKPIKFAVIGLGAGSLAAYARPATGPRAADECVIYEINPLVEMIAREYFWFLPDYEQRTGNKCAVRLGDARLTMEREEPQQYDVMVLDAFSGDSVPAHLLTREAFEIYQRHLRRDASGKITGCIVLHITNSFLNLYPVVKNASEQVMHMKYTSIYREGNRREYVLRTHYFIMTNDQVYLASHPMVKRIKQGVEIDYDQKDIPLWTDHYSNLFKILLQE